MKYIPPFTNQPSNQTIPKDKKPHSNKKKEIYILFLIYKTLITIIELYIYIYMTYLENQKQIYTMKIIKIPFST